MTSFQLPLSGSQLEVLGYIIVDRDQLSTPSLGITVPLGGLGALRRGSFQLPLSGSPPAPHSRPSRSHCAAFNSLSRDHNNVDDDVDAAIRHVFQLPLSGSRFFLYRPHHLCLIPSFQLPLSGSLDNLEIKVFVLWRLTFNSLSRDHIILALIFPPHAITTFNSLSRDHRALFRDFPALRGFPPRHPFAHLYFPATI